MYLISLNERVANHRQLWEKLDKGWLFRDSKDSLFLVVGKDGFESITVIELNLANSKAIASGETVYEQTFRYDQIELYGVHQQSDRKDALEDLCVPDEDIGDGKSLDLLFQEYYDVQRKSDPEDWSDDWKLEISRREITERVIAELYSGRLTAVQASQFYQILCQEIREGQNQSRPQMQSNSDADGLSLPNSSEVSLFTSSGGIWFAYAVQNEDRVQRTCHVEVVGERIEFKDYGAAHCDPQEVKDPTLLFALNSDGSVDCAGEITDTNNRGFGKTPTGDRRLFGRVLEYLFSYLAEVRDWHLIVGR
jgi:hypothetical protein